MTLLPIHPRLLIFLLLLILSSGCKQPETIVVEDSPTTAAPRDTTQEPGNEASFRRLVIGEYNTIGTMDPLFVENASEMRAVQLVYEGLVRLNSRGAVVPALADKWSVSDDSLQYRFQLRPDIFYHDSDVFSTGTGRKLTSSDVKLAFERMAKATVPPTAAQLFMDINGFDAYYQEQRHVYNPQYRRLEGISGIQTPSDTTVIFQLVKRDPKFLKKLATPMAAIYPPEAVGRTAADFSVVGSGPFAFSKQTPDSTFIFSRFQGYYAANEIQLNRIDIKAGAGETQLLRTMQAGETHLLPQLGPQLMQELLNRNGELAASYTGRYHLSIAQGETEYILRHNSGSDLQAGAARAILTSVEDTSSMFQNIPDGLIRSRSFVDKAPAAAPIKGEVYTTFSTDPFIQTFLGNLSERIDRNDLTFQMREIRAPSRNTGLFFTQNFPLIPAGQWMNYEQLFSFSVKQAALYRSEINGLSFNRYPWWLDVRGVKLPAAENLN